MTDSRLPERVRILARQMFAGESTGFAGWEIRNYFVQYDNEVEDFPSAADAPSGSRWAQFDGYLGLFTPAVQRRMLLDLCDFEGKMKYARPSSADLEKLRSLVLESPLRDGANTLFDRPTRARIHTEWEKALKRVETDPGGAITSARTLVETVCKHILDARGLPSDFDGDLGKLYKATANSLKLTPDTGTTEIVKQVLGGCASVVNGLAAKRNALGDAHGKTPRDLVPSPRLARLSLNAAGTLAMFLIETEEENSAS